jgi:hypothetical protein
VLVLRLLAYLLWIPALFAVIAAVILPVVGSGLSRRVRGAADAGPPAARLTRRKG